MNKITYFDELKRAMNWLAEQPNTIFIGQAVKFAGTGMSNTLVDVPENRKIEMPVAEDMQAGISLGISLIGTVPISIFPRWNFAICAANQIVNHIDKWPMMSPDNPGKVIIRTAVGSVFPLDPQNQHKINATNAFRKMLDTIRVVEFTGPENIFQSYVDAYNRNGSTILVERPDLYSLEL